MKHVALVICANAKESSKQSALWIRYRSNMNAWMNGDTVCTESLSQPKVVNYRIGEGVCITTVQYMQYIEFYVESSITAKQLGRLEHIIYQTTYRRYPDKQFDHITIEHGTDLKDRLRVYINKRIGGSL